MCRALLVVITLFTAPLAFAQSRCDCEVIVDQCRARVTELPAQPVGSRFLVKADTEQCAIVEWSVDGTHGQTTVWDHGEEVSRASPSKPVGTIEVESCRVCKDTMFEKKAPPRLPVMAKCAFPDGTVVAKQLLEVGPGASAEEKRAAAEQVCKPIMEAASDRCDDFVDSVEKLKSEWRIAPLEGTRARELETEIRKAFARAPAYCK